MHSRASHGSASRRDLLKFAAAAPFATGLRAANVVLERFPYLQDVGSDHAVVMWTTQQRGIGSVEFSTDKSFSRSALATVREFLPAETRRPVTYYQYLARLTDLQEGTQYFYRVMVDRENLTPTETPGQDLRFRTAAKGPLSFLAFGDSGDGSLQQAQLAGLMASENVDFLMHVGDMAYPDGTYWEFESFFFAPYRNLISRSPIFLSPGNHEYYTREAAPYLAVSFPPAASTVASDRGRYYSFDWGDVHFISLDSNTPLIRTVAGSRPMLQWLEDDLRRTRKFWRIAFFHHPPYPTSVHHEQDEVSALVRQHLVPILERYGVPLVINGHDHNYQRFVPLANGAPAPVGGRGTQYVITGGGGASLYSLPGSPIVASGSAQTHYVRFEIDGAKATIHAKGLDGGEFDRVEVTPAPSIGSSAVVNAASFSTAIAPGGLVTIFGRNLAYREERASSFPLPLSLLGVTVAMDGQSIPLTYVSPDQINAQIPFTLVGSATLAITTPNGTSTTSVSPVETAPGIFVSSMPAIIHNDGRLVSPAAPATPGEFISIYVTGLGRVNATIVAGHPAPSVPLATVLNTVQVRLGTMQLNPQFAGLAPGYAGLYQVVVQVPTGTRSGAHTLEIQSRGSVSNAVSLPVSATPGNSPAEENGRIADLLQTIIGGPRVKPGLVEE